MDFNKLKAPLIDFWRVEEEYKERFFSKITTLENGCWKWIGSKNGQGYGNFWYKKKCMKAHRFSLLALSHDVPENLDVCHKCDNPWCVNPSHLFVGTTKDNMRDMWSKGRCSRAGSRNSKTKLLERDIKEIRELSLVLATKELSEKFSLSTSQIRRIVRGSQGGWRHV